MGTTRIKPLNIPIKVLDVGVMGNTSLQTYILDENSNIWAWGQIAGADLQTSIPFAMTKPNNIRFSGLRNGCIALDASSYAWNWGNYTDIQPVFINSSNSTGFNTVPQSMAIPTQIPTKPWLDVQGLETHHVALDFSSYAWAWGIGNNGQLGNNSNVGVYSPVSVVGGRQFTKIAAGLQTNYALDSNSYAWAWGLNLNGALGDNSFANGRSSPVSVVGGKQFRRIVTTQSSTLETEWVTLALDSSSYCWAWGTNTYGQFGNNTAGIGTSSPISVNGPWDNIYSLGGNNFLGLRGGYFYVWGANAAGEFGNNTRTSSSSPLAVAWPFKSFIKIVGSCYSATGSPSHVAAIDANSNLWVWGYNNSGYALASGDTNSYSRAIYPQYRRQVYTEYPTSVSITTNFYHGPNQYFFDSSGYCWGYGANGSYGAFGTNNSITPTVTSSPVSVVGGIKFLRLMQMMSPYAGCTVIGIDISSYAWAWGYQGAGELGDGTNSSRNSPVSIIGNKQWIKTVGGYYTTMGLDLSSYAWAWGSGQYGQLGIFSDTNNRSSPVSVVGGLQFIDIDSTQNNGTFIGLNSSSYAWTWGNNNNGQLGDGTVTTRSSPVSVIGGRQFIKIGSSFYNFYALDSSSYMWSWGVGTNGTIGNNTITSTSSPVSVVGGKQFIKIFSFGAMNQSIAGGLDASSYAWLWGANGACQLGSGDQVPKSSPVSVVGGVQFTNIQAYSSTVTFNGTTVGISSSSIYVWGAPNPGIVLNRGFTLGSLSLLSNPWLTVQQPTFTYITSPSIGLKNILGK